MEPRNVQTQIYRIYTYKIQTTKFLETKSLCPWENQFLAEHRKHKTFLKVIGHQKKKPSRKGRHRLGENIYNKYVKSLVFRICKICLKLTKRKNNF